MGIRRIATALGSLHSAEVAVDFSEGSPPVINPDRETSIARHAASRWLGPAALSSRSTRAWGPKTSRATCTRFLGAMSVSAHVGRMTTTSRCIVRPSMSTRRCSASAPVSSTASRGRRSRFTAPGKLQLTLSPRRRSSWSGSGRPCFIALVLPLVFGGCGDAKKRLDWTSVGQLITEEVASVPALTTTEPEALLSDSSHEVILLDVRKAEAQYPAYVSPCQRFTPTLTNDGA